MSKKGFFKNLAYRGMRENNFLNVLHAHLHFNGHARAKNYFRTRISYHVNAQDFAVLFPDITFIKPFFPPFSATKRPAKSNGFLNTFTFMFCFAAVSSVRPTAAISGLAYTTLGMAS